MARENARACKGLYNEKRGKQAKKEKQKQNADPDIATYNNKNSSSGRGEW
jgi:hypothetical protein